MDRVSQLINHLFARRRRRRRRRRPSRRRKRTARRRLPPPHITAAIRGRAAANPPAPPPPRSRPTALLTTARGGRRETTGKVLKDRRSPRQRGRTGTSVRDAPEPRVRIGPQQREQKIDEAAFPFRREPQTRAQRRALRLEHAQFPAPFVALVDQPALREELRGVAAASEQRGVERAEDADASRQHGRDAVVLE
eukprot:31545-Pelagococcus_subviridis.AAC.8